MDDEDKADAEEARSLDTAGQFTGFGFTKGGLSRGEPLMDIFKTSGETMGVKLLKKMGWREGQGIGPKVKRLARLDDGGNVKGNQAEENWHLFAPENSRLISLVRKDDRKGLGFEGESPLTTGDERSKESELGSLLGDDADDMMGSVAIKSKKKKKPERRGGFGVGILNDNGSDEEDPYQMGPQISYNRVIGGDKQKKAAKQENRTSANPLLNSRPVFISKKITASRGRPILQRCHDGRLPLDGFVVMNESSSSKSTLSQAGQYPPPKVPEGWTSSKVPANSPSSGSSNTTYKSPAEVAAAAKLSPKSRAAMLGESQLPGKSIFDFLSPAARDRIAAATNNPHLPPALNEGSVSTQKVHTKSLASLIPSLEREIALTALGRGTAGWMPYTEDPAKRVRYKSFLEIHAALRPEGSLPDRALGMNNEDWFNEMNEFVRAAQIFKPMTGSMASRFTSSSAAPKLASDNAKLDKVGGQTGEPELLSQPRVKTKSTAEEAAAAGMYGPLTRSTETFYPSRLLCKRFNVKPPSHVQQDPDQASGKGAEVHAGAPPTHSTALPQRRLELIGKKDMEELKAASNNMDRLASKDLTEGPSEGLREESSQGSENKRDSQPSIQIDPERNEALEKDRPGDAIFKAIFGSDSEDD